MKEEFDRVCRELLTELEIESFSFHCYTPYFNDGDTCHYGVHLYGEAMSINDERTDDHYGTPEYDELMTKAKTIEQIFSELPNDFFEDTFGDHTEIRVSRDGITQSHYDHD